MNRSIALVVGLLALASLACSACNLPFPIAPSAEPTWPPTSAPPMETLPPPSPTPAGLPYRDDFSDPDSGWEVGEYDTGSVGYGDGYYYVISTDAGWTMWGAAFRRFTDVVIEVDATQVSAGPESNNDYGVICRLQPEGDGYYLVISGDGYYAVYRAFEGEFEALVDWTPSDAIRQGNATNQLRAVCEGTHLTLYANQQLLAEVDDATFLEGDIGLTATTYEDQPTEVHFDNLVVTAP